MFGPLESDGEELGRDDDVRNIPMEIPKFLGKVDPNAFVEWDNIIEAVFDCDQYSNRKKFRLAVMSFRDYVISW